MQKRCDIGGQAVMEGVMMRSKERIAMAVRDEEGRIILEVNPAPSPLRAPWSWPILRGIVSFGSSLVIGMKTLMRSSEYLVTEEAAPTQKVRWYESFGFVMTLSMVLAVGLAVGLFFILPTILMSLVGANIQSPIVYNLLEGIFRIAIFVSYLALCTLLKDVRRTFQYHGAEHQVIACFEKGEALTADNAKVCTPYHPRCGTSFILLVFVIGILVFSLFGKPESLFERVGLRLLLLPLVAGIAYEALKGFAYQNHLLAKIIRGPGLLLQRLTVLRPDERMLEVAIYAFEGAQGTRAPIDKADYQAKEEPQETKGDAPCP